MFRRLVLSAVIGLPVASAASAQEAFTTRIEPRPFYGAVVTVESGVRVFRPLPPNRQVIVNPGGQTPLHLGYNDTRVIEESKSYNYNYHDYAAPRGYGGGLYVPDGRGFRHGGGHGGHHGHGKLGHD
jgi:hypothetical protein